MKDVFKESARGVDLMTTVKMDINVFTTNVGSHVRMVRIVLHKTTVTWIILFATQSAPQTRVVPKDTLVSMTNV